MVYRDCFIIFLSYCSSFKAYMQSPTKLYLIYIIHFCMLKLALAKFHMNRSEVQK